MKTINLEKFKKLSKKVAVYCVQIEDSSLALRMVKDTLSLLSYEDQLLFLAVF